MNSEMSAIRKQLLAECPPPSSAEEMPSISLGMSSPQLPNVGHEVSWQSSQQADATQALRQRATAQAVPQLSPEELAAQSPSTATVESPPPDIHRYLQRLYAEAEKINDLYRQQETAIRKFQNTVNGLSLILMKQPPAAMMRVEQICEIQDAALTQVVQDENHRYILTAVDLDLTSDVKDASETAAALRDRAHRASSDDSVAPIAAVTGFLSNLRPLWTAISGIFDKRSPMSFLDYLVWFGGGVIGRLVLDLTLAVFPGFWPGVIGIIIGAVGFGLYRLLFAKKADMTLIVCIFLALVGLVIGGQI